MKNRHGHSDRRCTVIFMAGYLLGFGVPFSALFLGLLQQISIGKGSFLYVNAEVRKLCSDILWWDKFHFADFGMVIARKLVAFEIEFLGISPTNAVEFPVLISGTCFCLFVGAATGAMTSGACLILRKMLQTRPEKGNTP